MEELFFELIRVAIGTQENLSRVPTAREWEEVYQMAKKQSLVGICFAGIQKLGADAIDGFERIGMDELLYLTWMGMAGEIQKRNAKVNRQCVELQERLTTDGYRNYIMKGQSNAVLYGELHTLRQPGDIDVFIEGGLDKVLAYAQSFGDTKQVNELEMHVDVFPDTEVEFHYIPFFMRSPIHNKRLQTFLESKKEECFANKITLPNGVGEIVSTTVEFKLVHQLVHIHHHFFTEGIGMRQLMDYHFVLSSANRDNKVDKKYLDEVKMVISNLSLNCFASALMWVLGHVFDFPKEQMLWQPNKKNGRLLLDEVVKSGNFGHMNETKIDLSNKWESFWYVNGKTFRFWKFDHWAWFWSSLWRTYHFVWRKFKGYK